MIFHQSRRPQSSGNDIRGILNLKNLEIETEAQSDRVSFGKFRTLCLCIFLMLLFVWSVN